MGRPSRERLEKSFRSVHPIHSGATGNHFLKYEFSVHIPHKARAYATANFSSVFVGTTMFRRSTIKRIAHLLSSEDGPTSVEYAFIVGAILAVCIASFGLISGKTKDSFNNSGREVGKALVP
jgi:Flp pilus assembly pilin Flp